MPEVDVQEEVACLGELIVALDADRLRLGEEIVELLPSIICGALRGRLIPDIGVAVDIA